MSFNPILRSTMVEVPLPEYEKLVRNSESIAAVKRLLAANDYISTKDIAALLDINAEERETEE